MDLEETRLPGIGLRHDFMTVKGRRVGVVSQRSGQRELLVYDRADPDACEVVVALSPEESEVLAELLFVAPVVERLARLRDQAEGMTTEELLIEDRSPFVGRTLGDAAIRSRTGASIVAVVRRDELIPSPTPDFSFDPGDRVVVVGTHAGVRAAAEILAGR